MLLNKRNAEEMVVTPWKVSGKIDYNRLIQKFGCQPLTEDLLNRIEKYAGNLHLLLRRGYFFCHRDLNWILDEYEKGNSFVLYTGRGPSGPIHLGHIVPWMFTKYLQDAFNVKLYFQITDDEKYLIHPEHSLGKIRQYTMDNVFDIIAMGFNSQKTKIIVDTKNITELYNIALRVAKNVNFSTVKAVFGFEDSSNIGIIFFPAIQAAPSFLESELSGKNVPCLIPAAIDQDPYWRVTRDTASKLGYYKPAQIHCKFLPGLGKGGKMSSSIPETCIFLKDSLRVMEKKIMNAYTGGQATIDEQRKYGGRPETCPVGLYHYYIFQEDDKEANKLRRLCEGGALLCGDCKVLLIDKIKKFLFLHRKKKEEAKNKVGQYLM